MRPVPLALTEGPFTGSTARAHGVTPGMLRGRRFRALLHDVYVSSDTPVTHELLCRAARLALPSVTFSHASACCLTGLPLGLNEPDPAKPHVTSCAGDPVPDHRGLTVHTLQLPRWHVTTSALGATTSAARTFVDRAAELSLEDLVALGDAMLGRRMTTEEELATLIAWAERRPGVVRARRALGLLEPKAGSPMESRLRLLLVLAGLPRPEAGADVLDADGGWLARVDLLYREFRIVIEYDGRVHLGDRQRRADLRRRNLLTGAGYVVLHFTADDVLRHPHLVIDQVTQALRAAGCRTGPLARVPPPAPC